MMFIILFYLFGVFFVAGMLYKRELCLCVPVWERNIHSQSTQNYILELLMMCTSSWLTLIFNKDYLK